MQFNDDGRVIGRLRFAAWAFVDLARHQSFCELRRQQEMVDADAAIICEGLPEIIPKRELADFARMQRSECIRISETKHGPVACPGFRLKQRVVHP